MPISSGAVIDLPCPSSELVDSEEEDEDFWGPKDGDCWGGDDRVFPHPLGEFSPATHLTWT